MVSTDQAPEVATPVKRPRGVTVVAVIVLLQGLFFVAIGALLALADTAEVDFDTVEFTAEAVRILGVILLVVGLVEVVLAVGLLRGNEFTRSLFGLLASIEAAVSIYALVALRNVQFEGVVALAISVLVLWLLYGSDPTREFFEQ